MLDRGFSGLNQKDWMRACKKLGLEVDCTRGKGSHCLIKHHKTGAKYTLQKGLHKFLNIKILKKCSNGDLKKKTYGELLNKLSLSRKLKR